MRTSHISLAALVTVASLASLDAIAASPPALTIGEVTTEVVRQDVDLGATLRTMLEQELPGVDIGRPRPKPTVLSVSLLRMERTAVPGEGNKTQVSVVVSATLRDKKKGAVVSVVEGRARAENDERLVDLLEHAALKSAVRGALARVPEALDPQR